MANKIRILIVDDHAVLRAGLRLLLNAEDDMLVVGEAQGISEALLQLSEVAPDVVIVDISMPEMSGLDGLKDMKRLSPDSHFIILTMHNDEGYLKIALAAGASGYVLKQAANTELLSAIRVVVQGGTYLHPSHKSLLFSGEGDPTNSLPKDTDSDLYNRLSPREKEIFQLIAAGYTNRQAAEKLFISEKTIETYKSRLMEKMGIQSRVDLVKCALRLGIIKK